MTMIEVKLPVKVTAFRTEYNAVKGIDIYTLVGKIKGQLTKHQFQYPNVEESKFKEITQQIQKSDFLVDIVVDVELKEPKGYQSGYLFELPHIEHEPILIKKLDLSIEADKQEIVIDPEHQDLFKETVEKMMGTGHRRPFIDDLSQGTSSEINKTDDKQDEQSFQSHDLEDTATVNTMVIGTSRSGKDESLVFPATNIDEISDMNTEEITEKSVEEEEPSDQEELVENIVVEENEVEENLRISEMYTNLTSEFNDDNRDELMKFTKSLLSVVFEQSKNELVPLINLIVLEAKTKGLKYEEFKQSLIELATTDESKDQIQFLTHFNEMGFSNKLKELYVLSIEKYRTEKTDDELAADIKYIAEYIKENGVTEQ